MEKWVEKIDERGRDGFSIIDWDSWKSLWCICQVYYLSSFAPQNDNCLFILKKKLQKDSQLMNSTAVKALSCDFSENWDAYTYSIHFSILFSFRISTEVYPNKFIKYFYKLFKQNFQFCFFYVHDIYLLD